jgi:hypothetical protein
LLLAVGAVVAVTMVRLRPGDRQTL